MLLTGTCSGKRPAADGEFRKAPPNSCFVLILNPKSMEGTDLPMVAPVEFEPARPCALEPRSPRSASFVCDPLRRTTHVWVALAEWVLIPLWWQGTHLFQFEPILREDIEKQAHARALRLGSAEGNRTLEIVQLLMKDTIEDHLVSLTDPNPRSRRPVNLSELRFVLGLVTHQRGPATQVHRASTKCSWVRILLLTQHNDLKEIRARAAGKKKSDKAEYAGKTVTMLNEVPLEIKPH